MNTFERLIRMLPGYLQDGSNINIIFAGLAKQFDDIISAMETTELYRDIDQGQGYSLDVIGDIVGENRQGREDNSYRIALKTKVISNRSSGDIETINEYARAILGDYFVGIIEKSTMNLNLRYTFNPYSSKEALVNIIKSSLAAGVGLDTSIDIQAPVAGAYILGELNMVTQTVTVD